eukprot:9241694-Heterocapsa_arctica.AAC.1
MSTQGTAEDKSHAYCMGNKRKRRITYGGNNCKRHILGKTSKSNIDNYNTHTHCMGNKRNNQTTDGGENCGDPIIGKMSEEESGKGRRKTFGNYTNE